MQQPEYILETGTKIRTHKTLSELKGVIIGPGNMKQRTPDAEGTIHGVIGGYGGDLYWVQHPGVVLLAPYCFDEFELCDTVA